MVTPLLFGIMLAAIVSYIVIFATPLITELPVQITEEIKIIGVTEKGVVIETSSGVAVVTDQYEGLPGDIIKVTYSVPLKYLVEERNFSQDRVQTSLNRLKKALEKKSHTLEQWFSE